MAPNITAQANNATIELVKGDIVRQKVDAIVNAANTSLMGGGGVDGAIHRAAGPQLLEETRTLGGCDVGDAKITSGYQLPAKHVIHAVGPVYSPGNKDAPRLLASAYRRSLEVAAANNLQTVAFPAISTGVYRYPLDEAAEIALETSYQFLQDDTTRGSVALVRFVLFTSDAFNAFETSLRALAVRTSNLNIR